jgi:signal transduction histidine kinase
MNSVVEGSRLTAAVAVRILGGEKAGDIKVPAIGFATPKFDWRQMQRFGISERRLPPGSEIHFRQPTIWQQYYWRMLAISAALVLQMALIIALIWEDRRRRRSEADALALAGELAHMNRVVTAGQLTASIAHEIRQPLTSIASFGNAGLNWLKRQPPNIDNARSGLENIVTAVRRADEVIKTVTALFKNEPTPRTSVYVNDLIQRVLISTAQARDANAILLDANFVENPPPYVMADPGQLQQVILNLIANAIDALSASERGARILLVETSIGQNDSVVITVADSGPGFDPKLAEQLFKPFFTTKSGGMGLGLPICKSIIEAHGGQLTAASRKPRGAVFRIELPRHRHETNDQFGAAAS